MPDRRPAHPVALDQGCRRALGRPISAIGALRNERYGKSRSRIRYREKTHSRLLCREARAQRADPARADDGESDIAILMHKMIPFGTIPGWRELITPRYAGFLSALGDSVRCDPRASACGDGSRLLRGFRDIQRELARHLRAAHRFRPLLPHTLAPET